MSNDTIPHSDPDYLGVLTHTSAETVTTFVNSWLDDLGEVQVLENRTGLVMLPYSESVQGTVFHLGEVLIAEARVCVREQEGYGACLGRDLVQALAIAVFDAAWQLNFRRSELAAFIETQAQSQAEAEETLLRQVESTRVQMETFEW